MDDFKRRFDAFLERVQGVLTDMTPRDRALTIGLVVTFTLVLFVGGGWWMQRSLRSLETRKAEREDTLRFVSELAATHQSASNELHGLEADLDANASVTLSAFLEQAAERTGIRDHLEAVREKATVSAGGLDEVQFAVSLSDLSLDQVTAFLYEIETAGYPLKVRSTSIKVKSKRDDKLLTLKMDISAFKRSAEEP